MTLERAIEMMNDFYLRGYKFKTKEDYAALRLGIEGLKVIQAIRKGSVVPARVPLPGETEE